MKKTIQVLKQQLEIIERKENLISLDAYNTCHKYNGYCTHGWTRRPCECYV